MANMDYATPPLPPDVTGQQGAPVAQFIRGQGQQQPGQPETAQPAQAGNMQFVGARMQAIAQELTQVVKVLEVERPELLPIVQRMAQMGSMLMNEVQSSMSPQGTGGSLAPQQAQMAQGEGAASIAM